MHDPPQQEADELRLSLVRGLLLRVEQEHAPGDAAAGRVPRRCCLSATAPRSPGRSRRQVAGVPTLDLRRAIQVAQVNQGEET